MSIHLEGLDLLLPLRATSSLPPLPVWAGWRGRQVLLGAKSCYRTIGEWGNRTAFLRLCRARRRRSPSACSSAILRSRISARADRSSSLMSAAWSGGWFGSRPITVRLRTSRRTLSSLACNSANVGMGEVTAGSIPRWGLRVTCLHWTLFEWRLLRPRMRFLPETPRDLQGIHPLAFPPRDFISGLVQLSMIVAASWER